MVDPRHAPHLVDLDNRRPELTQTLFRTLGELQERHPVGWSEACGGFWVLTKHADIVEASADWETFSVADGIMIPPTGKSMPVIPAELDPPRHGAFRKLVLPRFTPKALQPVEDDIRRIVADAFGPLVERGRADLVTEFARPVPVLVICRVLGIDSDWERVPPRRGVHGRLRRHRAPRARQGGRAPARGVPGLGDRRPARPRPPRPPAGPGSRAGGGRGGARGVRQLRGPPAVAGRPRRPALPLPALRPVAGVRAVEDRRRADRGRDRRRWADRGVQGFALHPGIIHTRLQRHIEWDTTDLPLKTAAQGAATTVLVATAPELDETAPVYWQGCAPARVVEARPPDYSGGVAPYALDEGNAARLAETADRVLADL